MPNRLPFLERLIERHLSHLNHLSAFNLQKIFKTFKGQTTYRSVPVDRNEVWNENQNEDRNGNQNEVPNGNRVVPKRVDLL